MHKKILSLNKWKVFDENNKTSPNPVISHIKAYYTQIIDDVIFLLRNGYIFQIFEYYKLL